MRRPGLERYASRGVTLLGDRNLPGGVTFAFTERTGGVSEAPYASLNLGDACGDDPDRVRENRRRALAALGAEAWLGSLVNPRQVHGDHVVLVASDEPGEVSRAQREAREGADAVVCLARRVPVLLCFADCLPVVLVAPDGFAVAHSGWRGTAARIAAKAARELCRASGCSPADLLAYIGPHVAGPDYEVSQDLADRFEGEFGPAALAGPRHLDLAACVEAALADAGVPASQVLDCGVSTPRTLDRFYSYRAEGGTCGRHGAIAFRA